MKITPKLILGGIVIGITIIILILWGTGVFSHKKHVPTPIHHPPFSINPSITPTPSRHNLCVQANLEFKPDGICTGCGINAKQPQKAYIKPGNDCILNSHTAHLYDTVPCTNNPQPCEGDECGPNKPYCSKNPNICCSEGQNCVDNKCCDVCIDGLCCDHPANNRDAPRYPCIKDFRAAYKKTCCEGDVIQVKDPAGSPASVRETCCPKGRVLSNANKCCLKENLCDGGDCCHTPCCEGKCCGEGLICSPDSECKKLCGNVYCEKDKDCMTVKTKHGEIINYCYKSDSLCPKNAGTLKYDPLPRLLDGNKPTDICRNDEDKFITCFDSATINGPYFRKITNLWDSDKCEKEDCYSRLGVEKGVEFETWNEKTKLCSGTQNCDIAMIDTPSCSKGCPIKAASATPDNFHKYKDSYDNPMRCCMNGDAYTGQFCPEEGKYICNENDCGYGWSVAIQDGEMVKNCKFVEDLDDAALNPIIFPFKEMCENSIQYMKDPCQGAIPIIADKLFQVISKLVPPILKGWLPNIKEEFVFLLTSATGQEGEMNTEKKTWTGGNRCVKWDSHKICPPFQYGNIPPCQFTPGSCTKYEKLPGGAGCAPGKCYIPGYAGNKEICRDPEVGPFTTDRQKILLDHLIKAYQTFLNTTWGKQLKSFYPIEKFTTDAKAIIDKIHYYSPRSLVKLTKDYKIEDPVTTPTPTYIGAWTSDKTCKKDYLYYHDPVPNKYYCCTSKGDTGCLGKIEGGYVIHV